MKRLYRIRSHNGYYWVETRPSWWPFWSRTSLGRTVESLMEARQQVEIIREWFDPTKIEETGVV